ncbi:MAG: type IX secretion system membrane protein PorP/SprF [Bacteroidales bacterium]|jgi:type IX secretion system PorP/SprF family membrane protein|nr:type IX secretion system membrane protein PorP/SprF [Bacteroidales bacterium]
MKKLLRFLLYFFFVFVLTEVSDAQDPAFSQFYGNPLYLNPALAGNKLCPRITLNYRNQWPSIPSSFVTYSASFDQFVNKMNSGLGFLVVSDNAGDGILTNNSFSGIYSYRITLTDEIEMNAALQATFQQLGLNGDKLIFADPSDSIPGSHSIRFPDFSTGFLIGFRESIYAGLTVHHLKQPEYSFYIDSIEQDNSKQLRKITAHAGAIFNLGADDWSADIKGTPSVSFNLLYQQQGKFRQMNIGGSFNIYPIIAGIWFRHNFNNPDAVIALLGFEYKQYKIGYAYDYTISKLTNATGGSHEISVAYIFDCYQETRKSSKIKAIKCPSF